MCELGDIMEVAGSLSSTSNTGWSSHPEQTHGAGSGACSGLCVCCHVPGRTWTLCLLDPYCCPEQHGTHIILELLFPPALLLISHRAGSEISGCSQENSSKRISSLHCSTLLGPIWFYRMGEVEDTAGWGRWMGNSQIYDMDHSHENRRQCREFKQEKRGDASLERLRKVLHGVTKGKDPCDNWDERSGKKAGWEMDIKRLPALNFSNPIYRLE